MCVLSSTRGFWAVRRCLGTRLAVTPKRLQCGKSKVNRFRRRCRVAELEEVRKGKKQMKKLMIAALAACSIGAYAADNTCAPGEAPVPTLVAKAKNGAYANACDAAKCDQVVGARYKVTTEDYFVFKKINAEITGYPASLTGVELIENKTPCACK